MDRYTEFVSTQDALARAVEAFGRAPALGVDVESNSFFAYRERTCLVQVSTPDADYVIDPFAVDLSPLGPVLADARIEKILHASELDVVSLRRDHGFTIANLFDTLVAAKAVGRKKVGLASLVEESLGVKLAKDEQRSDWGRRPLSKEQLEYAFSDTRHLHALADILKKEILAKGPEFEEEVRVDCLRMTGRVATPREVDPESFEKHGSARKIDPLARQVLRSLFHARERRASETDRPPFRIVSDEALGAIALRQPTTKADLGKIPGVTGHVIGKHGDALLAAVLEGLERGPLPYRKKVWTAPEPLEEERFEKLRAWRRKRAEERGVEVDVIAGNAALKAIAKAAPKTESELDAVPELDAFRRRKYGAEILAALS